MGDGVVGWVGIGNEGHSPLYIYVCVYGIQIHVDLTQGDSHEERIWSKGVGKY